MRTTQFIGLTKRAQDYVHGLKLLESDTQTLGMFEEEIDLRRWQISGDFKDDRFPDRCIREIVQATPWSSGPMIFNCLEVDLNNGAKVKMLQWIDDPALRGTEYDCDTGRFWV